MANEGDNSVSVIDGNTFDTSTVPVWTPNFVLVNPQTNKIYVSTDGTLSRAIAVINRSTSHRFFAVHGRKHWIRSEADGAEPCHQQDLCRHHAK